MVDKNAMGIGGIIMLAIVMIVGAILFTATAQQAGDVVNTITVTNSSLGIVTNGTDVYLTDYRALSDVVIVGNATGASSATLLSGNYTVANNQVYNGGLAVKITPSADPAYSGTSWNLSATAEPTTYSNSSGGRAMTNLIVIMTALALAVVGIGFAIKQYK